MEKLNWWRRFQDFREDHGATMWALSAIPFAAVMLLFIPAATWMRVGAAIIVVVDLLIIASMTARLEGQVEQLSKTSLDSDDAFVIHDDMTVEALGAHRVMLDSRDAGLPGDRQIVFYNATEQHVYIMEVTSPMRVVDNSRVDEPLQLTRSLLPNGQPLQMFIHFPEGMMEGTTQDLSETQVVAPESSPTGRLNPGQGPGLQNIPHMRSADLDAHPFSLAPYPPNTRHHIDLKEQQAHHVAPGLPDDLEPHLDAFWQKAYAEGHQDGVEEGMEAQREIDERANIAAQEGEESKKK